MAPPSYGKQTTANNQVTQQNNGGNGVTSGNIGSGDASTTAAANTSEASSGLQPWVYGVIGGVLGLLVIGGVIGVVIFIMKKT